MFWDPPALPKQGFAMPVVEWEGVADRSTQSEGSSFAFDPHWPLNALFGAGESTSRVGEDFVRGFLASRYAFRADLKAAAAAAPGPFELPPHGRVERPTIGGEAWVDEDGLIRRVLWRQPLRRRPRVPGARKAPETTLWHELELWDFGLEG
jgi:hypothetical protein